MSIYQLIFGTQKHVLQKGQVKFDTFDLNSSRCFLLGGKNIKIEKNTIKKVSYRWFPNRGRGSTVWKFSHNFFWEIPQAARTHGWQILWILNLPRLLIQQQSSYTTAKLNSIECLDIIISMQSHICTFVQESPKLGVVIILLGCICELILDYNWFDLIFSSNQIDFWLYCPTASCSSTSAENKLPKYYSHQCLMWYSFVISEGISKPKNRDVD